MAQPEVTIYITHWCPYCARARQVLEAKGALIREVDVEAQPTAREEMTRRSGGRRTVPQIFVGDTHVGGCDDLLALDAAGGLDALLSGTGTAQAKTHNTKEL
ncbi:MAG TPA: glutaredoxin 3 [Steroidobacteraceae bacterium]|nr:glutaredoxin 3 [Steroidobacteraceae bacterium]